MRNRVKRWLALGLVGTAVAALALPAAGTDGKAEPDKKPAVSDKDARTQLLETVGTLAAAHYYQTYLNIGLIADARAEGRYPERDARNVLDSVLALLGTVDKQLDTVAKLDLDKEDRASLDQMRELATLLRQQGKELLAHWEAGGDDHATRYDELRKKSWAGISKLLGLGK
jgi:hypothetical protein